MHIIVSVISMPDKKSFDEPEIKIPIFVASNCSYLTDGDYRGKVLSEPHRADPTSTYLRVPEGLDLDSYETDAQGRKVYRREVVDGQSGEVLDEVYVPESGWVVPDESGECFRYDEKLGRPLPTNTVPNSAARHFDDDSLPH